MSDFVTRLRDEKDSLLEKLEKLDTFLESDKFNTLSREHQRLLDAQWGIMSAYYGVLCERLSLLERE